MASELQRLADELALARARALEAEARRTEAEAEIQRLESRIDKLEEDNSFLTDEVSSLRGRVSRHEASLANGLPHAGDAPGELAGVEGSAEWQFESRPGEWIDLPADKSAQLLKHYQDFAADGASAVCEMKSGTMTYTFDLDSMLQTNTRTGKRRLIRCRLNTPEGWTRSTSLQRIFKVAARQRVELSGFGELRINGVYTESPLDECAGCPVWWKDGGDAVMFVAEGKLRVLVIDECYCHLDWKADAESGEPWQNVDHDVNATLADSTHPCWGRQWIEGSSSSGSGVATAVEPSMPRRSLMDMAVEVTDQRLKQRLSLLLRDSIMHDGGPHGVASECSAFARDMRVVRVVRVENWHLWSKYCSHRQQMKRDFAQYGIDVDADGLGLPQAVSSFEGAHGRCDASIGEHLLFHGTKFETAVQIALEGFDFRLGGAGYYGRGTYFASQACKSHQYTEGDLRTLILSRVAVGDYALAKAVDRERACPPRRPGTNRCCDAVVAMPGPMPGHRQGVQTHQEFVIFDKFQAYPEFIIQYVVAA